MVGQVVTDQGIPISNRVMDGATSDIEWNRIALDYCEKVRSHGIFVADCKLMIEEHESLSGVYDTQKKPSKVGEKKGGGTLLSWDFN